MRAWIIAATIWYSLALPAEARLDDTVLSFKHSPLLSGDTLFKFDGRIGARYRFSGATRCEFGNGLLYLDTEDGTIVQETMILPLPDNPRDRLRVEKVVRMFLKETGIEPEQADEIYIAFENGIQAGKSLKKDLGGLNPFKRRYEFNVYANPSLHSILIEVALKP